jgi:hypothetical protein
MKTETLNKWKHLLVLPLGSTEDQYWEAAGKFTNACCWEEKSKYRMIKKTGGRKCNNPAVSVDCDKVVDINDRRYYDLVANGGSPLQSAGFSEQPGLVDPTNFVMPFDPGSSSTPIPQPPSNSVPYRPYDGDAAWLKVGKVLGFDYFRRHHGRPPNQAEIDAILGMNILNAESVVWTARTIHDCYMEKLTLDQSIDKHRSEWCAGLGVPVIPHPF